MANGFRLCKLDYVFYKTIYQCILHLISMVIYAWFYMAFAFMVGLCIFTYVIGLSCEKEVVIVYGLWPCREWHEHSPW